MHNFDVIIIGAGGAGMMCAMQAAARGRKVCLLDHSAKIGRKILISGGGRCNFTNIHATAANYVSNNPHFCKSALSRFTPDDFIALVRKHRISYHEKKLGQLFCDGSAESIVKLLVTECESAGVEFRIGIKVTKVDKDDNGFRLTVDGEPYACESLVIATGGLSIPKIGATGFGYDIARQFGLPIVEPFPALVGFHFNEKDKQNLHDMAGVAVDSVVSCKDAAFRENILFTHTGISGPAVLQASLYWHPAEPLFVDFCPGQDIASYLLRSKSDSPRTHLKNLLPEAYPLPKRFCERFAQLYAPARPMAEISDQVLGEFAQSLQHWRVVPSDNFGYEKAEVTRGGVDTAALSSKTMEAKTVPGLYFIGEVVDVTGQLGGFNFQWAWASGYAAAEAV